MDSSDISRSTTPGMISISSSVITGGTFTQHSYQIHNAKNGFDRLQEAVAPSAFHDSGERFNLSTCHSETRAVVVNKIMDWVLGQDPETQNALIMWLHGAAGSGKSAIAQSIAELYYAQGLLIASFFFGRSNPNTNHARSLFPTIAYQMALAVPQVRERLVATIENDPLILTRSLSTQFQSLIVAPLRELVQSGDFDNPSSRRLVIIDGLDECLDHKTQCAILDNILNGIRNHRLPLIFLVTSRPEDDLSTKFNSPEMDILLTRLILDDSHLSHQNLLRHAETDAVDGSERKSQPQEGLASDEFHIYAALTYKYSVEENPGLRWLSVTRGESLYTDGAIHGQVDMQGNMRKCYTVRNKDGAVGLIKMGMVVFQPLGDDFLPHMNQSCRSVVTLDYGSIPLSRWLPVTKDELLSTDGIVRIEDGLDGRKLSCYQVCNRVGRIGFIDASKIVFENEDQEPRFDKTIRSKVTYDYGVNPRSMWLPVRKGEILSTDGRSRIEVGLDGKRYQCYKARNDSGKLGFINVGNAQFV